MKKLLIVLSFLVYFVLLGCRNEQTYDETVALKPENFNEHFVLDFETVESGDKVFVVTAMKPRFDANILEINVTIRFYYYYQSTNNEYEIIYEFDDIVFDDPSTVD